MEWLSQHRDIVGRVFSWLEAESPVLIGAAAAPRELIGEHADDFVQAVAAYIQHAPVADASDIQVLQHYLAAGAAVAPHGSSPDFDLVLLRLVAGKLATVGFAQAGRDLVEQALATCRDSARRRRLAWYAVADVYLRTGTHLDGLLALACSLASGDQVDEEQAFHESIALARAFRDIGLEDSAMRAVAKAREIMKRMGLEGTNAQRVDLLELQIRQRFLTTRDPHDPLFQSLLSDAVSAGRTVLAIFEDTEPVAALLAPLVRRARLRGATMPTDAQEVLDNLLEHARGAMATRIRAMAAPSPSADQLATLARTADTRYSDDVGYDANALGLLAAHALADDAYIADARAASLALELTADRGVAVPAWDGVARPPAAPDDAGTPAAWAQNLANDGLAVVQAGLDDEGCLVRVETAPGDGEPRVVREPSDLFSEERFRAWSQAYPYGYGTNDGQANMFYNTTENLRYSTLPPGPVVLSCDTHIQSFPPNLLRLGDDFAGRRQPVAATPSLAWLAAARAKAAAGDGRRCAWISSAAAEGQTLTMIADRLRPTFEAHAFRLDEGAVLPSDFAGASIAVIAAHGGVHPDGRYFQVVSDEGVLRVSATDLANALHNVTFAVLFVCSGGRADKHPAANTTLGLAKQVLDRGCSAVVASPWPLDSRVPSHWLPPFMAAWDAGKTLIEANFDANRVVDQNFALDPARGLAMTLFGDPIMRKA